MLPVTRVLVSVSNLEQLLPESVQPDEHTLMVLVCTLHCSPSRVPLAQVRVLPVTRVLVSVSDLEQLLPERVQPEGHTNAVVAVAATVLVVVVEQTPAVEPDDTEPDSAT